MGNEEALPEATRFLLRNPDKLKDWLSIADKHMQTYQDDPKLLVIPKAHEHLAPLVGAFAEDLEGFTFYLLELRDNFDRNSTQFKDIQAVYRRINGRLVQQQRRERIRRAVAKAEELYGEIPFTKRMQWMADVEHDWARRRLSFLEIQRKRLRHERLSTELRTELLLEFWDVIDTEIYEGKVPPWNLPKHGVTRS